MTTFSKPVTLGDIVKREVDPGAQRETIILAAGKHFAIGTVLGRRDGSGMAVASAAVPDASNTGNGTLTLAATPVDGNAIEGAYRINFASSTRFNVENPRGENIGTGTVGTAFGKQVAFTIAAGGTPFAAGDAFTLTVSFPANDGICDEWDPSAGGGLERVYGVLLWPVDTTSGSVRSVALAHGPAMLADELLVFKAGLSAAQHLDGLAALTAKGLAVRETV